MCWLSAATASWRRPPPSASCFADDSCPSTDASTSTGTVAARTNAWNASFAQMPRRAAHRARPGLRATAPVAIRSATTTAIRPLTTSCSATGRIVSAQVADAVEAGDRDQRRGHRHPDDQAAEQRRAAAPREPADDDRLDRQDAHRRPRTAPRPAANESGRRARPTRVRRGWRSGA